MLFSNPVQKDLKLTVYYESHYDSTWFKPFKDYKIEYVKFKYKSNYATHIIRLDNSSANTYKFYLIDKPLLFDSHKIKNYRIAGLTFKGKQISVITLRLNNKNTKKVILHEFAHGLGLPHCTHKNCIMNDARGKLSNLDNCNSFKESCLKFMQANSKL